MKSYNPANRRGCNPFVSSMGPKQLVTIILHTTKLKHVTDVQKWGKMKADMFTDHTKVIKLHAHNRNTYDRVPGVMKCSNPVLSSMNSLQRS